LLVIASKYRRPFSIHYPWRLTLLRSFPDIDILNPYMLNAEIISFNPLFIAGKFTIHFQCIVEARLKCEEQQYNHYRAPQRDRETKKVGDTEGSGPAPTQLFVRFIFSFSARPYSTRNFLVFLWCSQTPYGAFLIVLGMSLGSFNYLEGEIIRGCAEITGTRIRRWRGVKNVFVPTNNIG